MRSFTLRLWWPLILLPVCAVAILWRALFLQWINQDFLEKRGNGQSVRVEKVLAHRGPLW